MSKLTAKEIRTLAWNDLAAKQYLPFVGGVIVVSLVTFVIVAMAVIAAVVFAIGLAPCATGIDPWNPKCLLPMFLVSCAVTVPALYAIGFYTWGATKMSLTAVRREMKFSDGFSGWGHGWKMCWTLLVEWTYVQLWALLLVVPGVVKAFAYAMTPFVQVEHPDWTANACIAESQRLMDGNKWRYFCLNFSFLGWWFLCALVSAIVPVSVFLYPYVYTAQARFYDEVKREKSAVV